MTTLKCQNCGGTVELDSELPVAFCPYCGAKSLIDEKNLGRVYAEKEKTKRLNMRLKHDLLLRKQQDQDDIDEAVGTVALICIGIIVLLIITIGSCVRG